MEDIAIIRVTGGSDFFCIFSGILNLPHTPTTTINSPTIITDTNPNLSTIPNLIVNKMDMSSSIHSITSSVSTVNTAITSKENEDDGSVVSIPAMLNAITSVFTGLAVDSGLSSSPPRNTEIMKTEIDLSIPPPKPPRSEKNV